MKLKGSKYAKKHKLPVEVEDMHPSVQVPPEFLDFFENHYDFSKRFLKLDYHDQVGLISCLYSASKSDDKEYSELASFYLDKVHLMTDSDYEEGVFMPVAVDEKKLVRMDCYGSISARRPDQLSDLYKYFRGCSKKQKHLMREYDLQSSPNWKVMAQFESFRRIENKLKRAMFKSQINPDVLKVMTVNDFCDVIYNTFQDGTDKAHFIEREGSIRNCFVKQFMKECGDSFYRTLLAKGIDERCVKSLCNKMRRFGACDLESLTVTEMYFTPRVLKDLQKAGYNTSKFEVGMPIPDKLTNQIIDSGKEDLLVARNPDGTYVDKYNLPRLEVHHNHAVKFADKEYLACSNYPNRLVLVEAEMHRGYYHLYDSIVKQNNLQNYFSRLNISSQYMRMRIGFAPEDALFGDFENTPAFHQRAVEDKKHRVNYFDMQEEYLKNVTEIIRKYNVRISHYGVKQYQNILNEIKPRKGNVASAPVNKKDYKER